MVVENKKFQVGDKVISTKNTPEVPEGFVGYIIEDELDSKVYGYAVKGKYGSNDVIQYFNEDELELLSLGQSTVRLEGELHPLEIKGTLDPEHTGGSVNYYKVHVANPTTLPEAYDAEANDIIESLGLTFAEGNLFKAIWRMAADRNGKKKKGNNSVYDAEKLVFFAERVLVQEKAKNEPK